MLFKTRVKDSPGYIEILPQKCILIIMNHESHYLLPQPFYLKKKKKRSSQLHGSQHLFHSSINITILYIPRRPNPSPVDG